jgi:hypothetical protein
MNCFRFIQCATFRADNKAKHTFVGIVDSNSISKSVQLGRKDWFVIQEDNKIVSKLHYYFRSIFRNEKQLEIGQENCYESNNIILESFKFN